MPIRTKHYAFIPRKKGGDHVFFFFRVAQFCFNFIPWESMRSSLLR